MMSDDNVKETKDKNAAHKNQVAKGKRTEREEWQNYTKERKSMEKVVKQAKGRALQGKSQSSFVDTTMAAARFRPQ